MPDLKFMRFEDQPGVDRGTGAKSFPLVTNADGTEAFTAGISEFQPGVQVPLHSHNVEEMVTVLEGSGECEIDGVVRPVKLFDTTFVPGGLVHCFRNTGDGPMKIMWVYATGHVTRTFAATGETVEHLTEADKIAGR